MDKTVSHDVDDIMSANSVAEIRDILQLTPDQVVYIDQLGTPGNPPVTDGDGAIRGVVSHRDDSISSLNSVVLKSGEIAIGRNPSGVPVDVLIGDGVTAGGVSLRKMWGRSVSLSTGIIGGERNNFVFPSYAQRYRITAVDADLTGLDASAMNEGAFPECFYITTTIGMTIRHMSAKSASANRLHVVGTESDLVLGELETVLVFRNGSLFMVIKL